jgi:hypothetical protein
MTLFVVSSEGSSTRGLESSLEVALESVFPPMKPTKPRMDQPTLSKAFLSNQLRIQTFDAMLPEL